MFSDSKQVFFFQTEWEELFHKASLNVVMLRKSYYGSALFLCRRRQQSSHKQPILIFVDPTDYKWVETLKVSVKVCMKYKLTPSIL